jgi:hypothetical protein
MGAAKWEPHNLQFVIVKSFIEFANYAFEILFADFARVIVVEELEGPSNLLCGIPCKYLFRHCIERIGLVSG